jgi:iron complex transport system ATP-binding protein
MSVPIPSLIQSALKNTVLDMNGVSYALRGRALLKAIQTSFRSGELTVIVGPNGAGKTTLLKTLCGLIAPSIGEIRLQGQAISSLSLAQRARTMAYLEQKAHVTWPLTVHEVVELGRLVYAKPQNLDEHQTLIHSLMEQVNVAHLANRLFPSLSGGEQARVLLARALSVEAPILLVDEPVAALDPHHQIHIMEILHHQSVDKGRCVLVVMHDLALAARFAHRMIVMNDGQMVADGDPATVLNESGVSAVFGVHIGTEHRSDGLNVTIRSKR